MLFIKDLVKVYKTKMGKDVRALDGVSIDFPDKGMVFLLGKSGSGKSTMLNVIGGLDFPTDGEINIDGRSSKDFTVADFDGYRNSCVGFVFQEFNILNEFNVEQNIALALQLQQKPNNEKIVEDILEMVDLGGVGKRKPNTLSGGQKQRVAIARALIKDPKIILADEPTGALDSATGKQVLDTLKKLSETRLVVVVTHDREFAEEYADRIIELADGKIISDVSRSAEEVVNEEVNVKIINDDTILVNDWAKVNEEEIKQIIQTMKKKGGSSYITSDSEVSEELSKKHSVKEKKTSKKFVKTEKKERRETEKKDVKFIKSNLPFKNAFKMAWDSLRLKPIRLIFTIFLSMVAFVFFGVASSLMMYDSNYAVMRALDGSDYNALTIRKEYEAFYTDVEMNKAGTSNEVVKTSMQRAAYSQADINKLNENKVGLNFVGVIDFGSYSNNLDSVNGYVPKTELFNFSTSSISVSMEYQRFFPIRGLTGFVDCGVDYLNECGFTLVGEYPTNYNEIAISEYMFNLIKNSKYTYDDVVYAIDIPADLIGKTIKVQRKEFVVTGIVDVGSIPERFTELYNTETQLSATGLNKLQMELEDILKSGFQTVGFVSDTFYEHYKYDRTFATREVDSRTTYGLRFGEQYLEYVTKESNSTVFTEKSVWKNTDMIAAYDLSGNSRGISVGYNDVLLPSSYITKYASLEKSYGLYKIITTKNDPVLNEQYKVFLEACRRLNAGTASTAEKFFIIETLFNDYETIAGVPMTFPETIYARSFNYDQTLNLEDRKDFSKTNISLNVVGFYYIYQGYNYDTNERFYVSDEFCEDMAERYAIKSSTDESVNEYTSNYNHDPQNEKYGKIITPTNNTREQLYFILNSGKNVVESQYVATMVNNLYKGAMAVSETINSMKPAFYLGGAIIGVFATLMLFNFISVTITSKKREIGILRAVGARRIDVFKIFIIEALIITISCFIVSAVLSGVACVVINSFMVSGVSGFSALEFKLINGIMLFFISTLVAFIATVMPVSRASKKAPVESIRSI